MQKQIARFSAIVLALILLAGAGLLAVDVQPAAAQDGSGTLEIYANGEDFIREGFVSKDGWQITFDTLTVGLADITAYQTDPPYDPAHGDAIDATETVVLDGPYVVDLAAGDADADPILVATVEDTPAGHYNALAWRMVNAEADEADDDAVDDARDAYTLVIDGTAEKDDETIDFTLRVETEYDYLCGEYVGDMRMGILDADDVAGLEMTFHFDHIFGDGDLPLDDSLNEHAPGFAMFATLAEDGMLDMDMAALEAALDPDDYQMLVDILPTLGHTGEGHCYEASMPGHDEADD